jgi:hypothetical protein
LNPLSLGLQILGLGLDLVGALLFAKGTIKSKTEIQRISETRFDENPDLKKSLLTDRKLGYAGLFFLCGGFVLQIVSIIVATV